MKNSPAFRLVVLTFVVIMATLITFVLATYHTGGAYEVYVVFLNQTNDKWLAISVGCLFLIATLVAAFDLRRHPWKRAFLSLTKVLIAYLYATLIIHPASVWLCTLLLCVADILATIVMDFIVGWLEKGTWLEIFGVEVQTPASQQAVKAIDESQGQPLVSAAATDETHQETDMPLQDLQVDSGPTAKRLPRAPLCWIPAGLLLISLGVVSFLYFHQPRRA